MLYLKKIENYFPAFLVLAVISGLLNPTIFMKLEQNINIHYFLMGIMTLLFLKIDLVDIIKHVKKPFLLTHLDKQDYH